MNILFIMIPMAIVLVVVAIAFFFWATNNKQFDDLDSPAYRMLLDDERDAVMQANKSKTARKTSQTSQTTPETTAEDSPSETHHAKQNSHHG